MYARRLMRRSNPAAPVAAQSLERSGDPEPSGGSHRMVPLRHTRSALTCRPKPPSESACVIAMKVVVRYPSYFWEP